MSNPTLSVRLSHDRGAFEVYDEREALVDRVTVAELSTSNNSEQLMRDRIETQRRVMRVRRFRERLRQSEAK